MRTPSPRLACTLFAVIVASPLLADTIAENWVVPEQAGWAKPNELVFTVATPGKLKLEGEIQPYCECGRGGFGYLQFEHRIAGRKEWVRGLPKVLASTDHTHRPNPWVDGQPAWDAFSLHALAGIERYEIRVVMRANAKWSEGAYKTPAQKLGVTITGIGIARVDAPPPATPAPPTPSTPTT